MEENSRKKTTIVLEFGLWELVRKDSGRQGLSMQNWFVKLAREALSDGNRSKRPDQLNTPPSETNVQPIDSRPAVPKPEHFATKYEKDLLETVHRMLNCANASKRAALIGIIQQCDRLAQPAGADGDLAAASQDLDAFAAEEQRIAKEVSEAGKVARRRTGSDRKRKAG